MSTENCVNCEREGDSTPEAADEDFTPPWDEVVNGNACNGIGREGSATKTDVFDGGNNPCPAVEGGCFKRMARIGWNTRPTPPEDAYNLALNDPECSKEPLVIISQTFWWDAFCLRASASRCCEENVCGADGSGKKTNGGYRLHRVDKAI